MYNTTLQHHCDYLEKIKEDMEQFLIQEKLVNMSINHSYQCTECQKYIRSCTCKNQHIFQRYHKIVNEFLDARDRLDFYPSEHD